MYPSYLLSVGRPLSTSRYRRSSSQRPCLRLRRLQYYNTSSAEFVKTSRVQLLHTGNKKSEREAAKKQHVISFWRTEKWSVGTRSLYCPHAQSQKPLRLRLTLTLTVAIILTLAIATTQTLNHSLTLRRGLQSECLPRTKAFGYDF